MASELDDAYSADVRTVWDVSQRLLHRMNAAARIAVARCTRHQLCVDAGKCVELRTFQPVSFSGEFEPPILEGNLRLSYLALIGFAADMADPVLGSRVLASLAAEDLDVRHALRIIGQPTLTWFDVYDLSDLLKRHKRRRAVNACWKSGQMDRVRQTANQHRHTVQDRQPLKNPPSLNDATVFILEGVCAWLAP
jgi:hypothetical protein